ncbi:MAG: peptide ABC transporter permease [Chloroflexi bacterium]|nr:MAG: peptide ABC transporter permease [Chloroflexota bacterium]
MSSIALRTPKSDTFEAKDRRWAWFHALRRHPLALVGGGIIILAVLLAIFAPWIAPYSYEQQNLLAPFQPPLSDGHLLGTDDLGRDVLSRMLYGSRVSLLAGGLTALIAGTVGLTVGLTAGYYGGRVDTILSRIIDGVLAMPALLLGLALGAVFRPGLTTIVASLGLVFWASYARIIRGDALGMRQAPFIEAARALGCRDSRIIIRHILPNVVPILLVLSSLTIAGAIIVEAGLSFLGVGIQPPEPSWGSMLSQGRAFIYTAWWLSTVPGVAIVIVVLGFNLFGDGLRDISDPRLRGR